MLGKGSRVLYEHNHFPGLDYTADFQPHPLSAAQMQLAQYHQAMNNSLGYSVAGMPNVNFVGQERYGFGYVNAFAVGAGGGGGGGTTSVTVPSARSMDSRMLPPPPAPIYPLVQAQTRIAFGIGTLIIILGLLHAVFPHGWLSTGWF